MNPNVLFVLSALLCLWVGCGDDRGRADAFVDSEPSSDSAFADTSSTDSSAADTLVAPVDSATVDTGGSPDAQVDLVFNGGCSPRFDGSVVVVRNAESIAVSATSGGALTGSIQLALETAPGTIGVSTRDRVDNMNVINVIEGTTFTNIARDSAAVLSEGAPDPIQGSLSVTRYEEAAGEIDVSFSNVTLQNPSDGRLCMINGRLQTFGLSF